MMNLKIVLRYCYTGGHWWEKNVEDGDMCVNINGDSEKKKEEE